VASEKISTLHEEGSGRAIWEHELPHVPSAEDQALDVEVDHSPLLEYGELYAAMIEVLSKEERWLLCNLYGIGMDRSYSLRELSGWLGVNHVKLWRIQQAAEKKLRKHLK
jgi:hypothetical protein